jgi:F5/8 type C domain
MPAMSSPGTYGHRARSVAVAMAAAVLFTIYLIASSATGAHAAGTLLSQGRPTTASSTENGGTPASAATDGNTATRWSSAFSDPQWLQVDLGAAGTITSVTINWEAAYARAFQIQTSTDATTWTSIYSTTTGTGGVANLTVTGTGRYVRMYGTVRATGYGYSIWEFQVFGSAGGGGGGTCNTGTNAALNKPATASSTENGGTPASAAFDGNTGTRWSSAFSDPQWLQVDLGSSQTVCQVTLNWEAAYAKSFQVQTSPDGTTWTTVYSSTTGTGGVANLTVSGTGRYVRMYGTVRATGYGYSIWEMAVFTTGSGGGGGGVTGGGSLGPNVIVFDPSMSGATIQSQVDSVFATQQANQFGTQRYALLFKPGSYSGFNAQIGFYTSIMGLGQNPDQTQIHGDVTVDAGWNNGNATQNFWRSASNMEVFPSAGFTRWAVAQAGPFRRMDIQGDLNLAPNGYGWASGGYISDSRITGTEQPYSQQQFFTRNSNIGGYLNGVWNMVNQGVVGAPAQSFPNPPYTTIATTPVSVDEPYLYLDSSGNYRVFVPSKQANTSGASWIGGNTPGSSIPLSQFYVAHPSDSAATLNQALSQGLNLLFTPGVYSVNQTINVTRADTVVLGIGFPTLIPTGGVNTMSVSDVNGVRLAGMLFDAGTTNSNTLLTVGSAGSGTDHSADPSVIQDVFFRVGGDIAGKATNSLVVNQNNAIIDHIWAWRADHGNGGTVGWTVNTADNGLTVNGNNVNAYGIFVEHYQKTEVGWNGNNGYLAFFQNEMPYDVPNAASWMNGSQVGFPAIQVGSGVTTFAGYGWGSYCNFTSDPSITAYHAFAAPNSANVKFHDLLTVSLGGQGAIQHIINDTGAIAQGTATVPVDLVSYP